jgi:hypothetical protein
MPPTFDTERCCPYHGEWIVLAECPIVATNEAILRPRFSSGSGAGSARDQLRDVGNAGAQGQSEAQPPLGAPIGPGRPAFRSVAPGGAYAVGATVTSRVDGVPRTVVALPPTRTQPKFERGFLREKRVREPLPTTAELAKEYGGRRARPVRMCPTCLHPLPETFDTHEPISVAMIGNLQASKTTMVAALMAGLRDRGPAALGVKDFTATETTAATMRPALEAFTAGRQVEQSQRGFHAPLEFTTELGAKRWPVTVMIHDVSGEDLMNRDERLVSAPHVLWADVVLYIYNPEESPKQKRFSSSVDQSAVLSGVLDDLLIDPRRDPDGKVRHPPLIVAVSKSDTLPGRPDREHGFGNDAAVKRTLIELRDGGIVDAGERWGDDTHWRFVSPKLEPESVSELFNLLLAIAV